MREPCVHPFIFIPQHSFPPCFPNEHSRATTAALLCCDAACRPMHACLGQACGHPTPTCSRPVYCILRFMCHTFCTNTLACPMPSPHPSMVPAMRMHVHPHRVCMRCKRAWQVPRTSDDMLWSPTPLTLVLGEGWREGELMKQRPCGPVALAAQGRAGRGYGLLVPSKRVCRPRPARPGAAFCCAHFARHHGIIIIVWAIRPPRRPLLISIN